MTTICSWFCQLIFSQLLVTASLLSSSSWWPFSAAAAEFGGIKGGGDQEQLEEVQVDNFRPFSSTFDSHSIDMESQMKDMKQCIAIKEDLSNISKELQKCLNEQPIGNWLTRFSMKKVYSGEKFELMAWHLLALVLLCLFIFQLRMFLKLYRLYNSQQLQIQLLEADRIMGRNKSLYQQQVINQKSNEVSQMEKKVCEVIENSKEECSRLSSQLEIIKKDLASATESNKLISSNFEDLNVSYLNLERDCENVNAKNQLLEETSKNLSQSYEATKSQLEAAARVAERRSAKLEGELQSLWTVNRELFEMSQDSTLKLQNALKQQSSLLLLLGGIRERLIAVQDEKLRYEQALRSLDASTSNDAESLSIFLQKIERNEELSKQIEDMKKKLEQQDCLVSKSNCTIDTMQQTIGDQQEKILEQQAELNEKKEALGEARLKLTCFEKYQKDREKELCEKMIEITQMRNEVESYMKNSNESKAKLISDLHTAREGYKQVLSDLDRVRDRFEAKLAKEMTQHAQMQSVVCDLEQQCDLIEDQNLHLKRALAELSSVLTAAQVPYSPLLKNASPQVIAAHKRLMDNYEKNCLTSKNCERIKSNNNNKDDRRSFIPLDFVEAYQHLFCESSKWQRITNVAETTNNCATNSQRNDKYSPKIPFELLPDDLRMQVLGKRRFSDKQLLNDDGGSRNYKNMRNRSNLQNGIRGSQFYDEEPLVQLDDDNESDQASAHLDDDDDDEDQCDDSNYKNCSRNEEDQNYSAGDDNCTNEYFDDKDRSEEFTDDLAERNAEESLSNNLQAELFCNRIGGEDICDVRKGESNSIESKEKENLNEGIVENCIMPTTLAVAASHKNIL